MVQLGREDLATEQKRPGRAGRSRQDRAGEVGLSGGGGGGVESGEWRDGVYVQITRFKQRFCTTYSTNFTVSLLGLRA